ncbi:MAG: YIP1 family protein [Gemmatimonadota bacterium]
MDTIAPNRSLLDRMAGAARLDIEVYEEVEHDPTATSQAAIVVGLVALAAAIGGAGSGGAAFFGGVVATYAGWLLWSGIIYLIGAHLMGGTATWGEVLRTVGFAQSPGVLYVLAILPLIGGVIEAAVFVWLLVAVFIAIRQALDVGNGAAALTAVLGWIPYLVVQVVVRVFTGVWPNLL